MINQRAVRGILKKFKVHFVMDRVFRAFPRQGKVGRFSYSVDSLGAWLVEKEIFRRQIYAGVFDLRKVRTFADLGANRGFFSLWLAANVTGRLEGIVVEANPRLVPQIKSLLGRNGLSHLPVFQGAVGAGRERAEIGILIPPTDVGAGIASVTREALSADVCETICVPALDFGKLWAEKFSNGEPCDFLKVDIEGAEGNFFKDETAFLSHVRKLVVEVHERSLPVETFRDRLKELGFSILRERREGSETSLIFAAREL